MLKPSTEAQQPTRRALRQDLPHTRCEYDCMGGARRVGYQGGDPLPFYISSLDIPPSRIACPKPDHQQSTCLSRCPQPQRTSTTASAYDLSYLLVICYTQMWVQRGKGADTQRSIHQLPPRTRRPLRQHLPHTKHEMMKAQGKREKRSKGKKLQGMGARARASCGLRPTRDKGNMECILRSRHPAEWRK